MSSYPKISIITPSFNQGQYLEQTISSVLEQDYPNLEYIIIDGGSTDDSVEIIKSYANRVDYWVSEQDSGQAEAINKGLKKATGEIIAWINSDDYYKSGVLERVANAYTQCPNQEFFWLTFAIEHIFPDSEKSRIVTQVKLNNIEQCMAELIHVNQQASFWSRQITQRLGLLDESLHLGLDTEYFLRFLANDIPMQVNNDFVGATFRMHSKSKTENFHGEIVNTDKAFLYDWTLARLKHLTEDVNNYTTIKKSLHQTLSYCEIRFSQDATLANYARLKYLYKAMIHCPSNIFSKAYLSSLKKILI